MPPSSVGLFPDYLSSVVNLLNRAMSGSRVDIYVDGPDHGSLADYKLHREAHEAIRAAKARGAKVRILLPVKLARVSRANPDFNYGKHFPQVKGTPGFKEFFQAQQPWVPEAQTREELDLSVDAYMNVRLQDYFGWNLGIAFLSENKDEAPMVFMWRVDNCVVYVPVPQERNKAAEAFLSSDPTEIRLLGEVFDRHWELASHWTLEKARQEISLASSPGTEQC